MQKMLQQLFDRECRNYAFYMQKLKVIERQYDKLAEKEEEILKCKESANRVNEISKLLKSEEFLRVKDQLNLPKNFNTFETKFSNYKSKDTNAIEERLEEHKDSLKPILKMLRQNLKKSKDSLFEYIEEAASCNVKFSFPKDNKIAIEIFILYYQDRFKIKYKRTVIDLKRCNLNEEFMEAYMAEEDKACCLFAEMAQKYQEF